MNSQQLENIGVAQIASELIKINTTNYGGGRSEGEQIAADYVEKLLSEAGLQCSRYEAAPGRTNLIARWGGEQPDLPALLLHGHLDVVPADASEWSEDPFGGVVKDGMVWGRGAVDMKGMLAMIIASVRHMVSQGKRPRRDTVLAFFADEEAGCTLGSQWMVDNHPEVFSGVSHAISEVGGFSIDIDGKRSYLLQTGEKGVLWLRLKAHGSPGHASIRSTDNAITTLARAVARLGEISWPLTLTETTAALLDRISDITGRSNTTAPEDITKSVGASAPWIDSSLYNVCNVTMFDAGYKENVVPGNATALIDVRYLPGHREAVLEQIRKIVGQDIDVSIEMDLIALESPFAGSLVEAIKDTLARQDPTADVLPYLLPAGTDSKALSRLGIIGYGFAPLRLPADLDFPALFHGVDERVPIDALEFGESTLVDLLLTY